MKVGFLHVFLAQIFLTIVIVLFYFKSETSKTLTKVFYQEKCNGKKISNSRLDKLFFHQKNLLESFDQLVKEGVDSRDPRLIQLALEMMDPPSYSFTLKLSRHIYQTPQAVTIDSILNKMRNGFFIEVGGYDGERSSNSIFFEDKLGWKGILIEADPFFYAQLLGKNRRSWSINACLSPTLGPAKLRFKGHNTGQGKVILESHGEGWGDETVTSRNEFAVPCFPLETLLLALNVSKVNYFSLDVEGMELEILKTIDFDFISIDTLTVEYTHGSPEAYRQFMKEKGYHINETINVSDSQNFLFAEDYVFVKDIFLQES